MHRHLDFRPDDFAGLRLPRALTNAVADWRPGTDVAGQIGMLRRALDDLLGFLTREPFFALQVFAEAARADREIAGQHGDAVFEDVHVGDFVPDVHQAPD